MLTPSDVHSKTFRVALRGYAEEEVDAFLERIEVTLREWETGGRGELKPQDVKQKTFRVALRGYAEEEVDQFLDEVVLALQDWERIHRDQEDDTTPEPPRLVEPRRGFLGEARKQQLDRARALRDLTPPAVAPVEPSAPEPQDAVPISSLSKEFETTPIGSSPITETTTRLIVTRTTETRGRPYTVLLDDKPIGKIQPGATERFEIPAGMHWVTAKTRKDQSNNLVIEPHEGDQITLTCGPAAGDQIDDLGRKMEGIILEMAE